MDDTEKFVSQEPADEPKSVRVRLLQPHRHKGVKLQPDAELNVDEKRAKWMRQLRIAVVIEIDKE